MFCFGLLLGSLGILGPLLVVATNREEPKVFSVPLNPSGTAELFWSLDYDSQYVQMEVHVPLEDARSWFAIGFSDYGEPFPADYCVFWQDWRGGMDLTDAWAGEDGRLSEDESQDCEDFRHTAGHNVTKFAFRRRFDTCDPKDYVIEDGTTHVVWAAGPGPLLRVAGVTLADTGVARGMQRAQLLKNIHVAARAPDRSWQLEFVASKVRVPAADTTYYCQMFELPGDLHRKNHVTKYEAVIQHGNEALVHHMELFHCVAPKDTPMPSYAGSCFAPDRPPATQVCKRVLAAWAMGAPPFFYPEEAGLPIGGPEFNLHAVLEIHYNNPEKRADVIDSSGIRFTLTGDLRPHDAGVIELGLEYTDKMAIPPGQAAFPLTGHCIAECTRLSVPPSGITVFGSQLHTHLTGVRVFTQHVRAGRELPELNRDNHYSSHFQEIRRLKHPVRVLPGDVLLTTCWFDTRSRPNVTVGGHAITDEMCLNYIHYYPKIDLEVCKSSISDRSLQTYFKILSEQDGQTTGPGLGVSDNYRHIEWTPLRARVLSALYRDSPLAMQCNRSSGARFPGNWDAMPPARIQLPLQAPPRACPQQ